MHPLHNLHNLHTSASDSAAPGAGYELRFQSLFNSGRAYAFPCDAAGHVDLDALSDTARRNYLYARAVVGHELSHPAVNLADAAH